MSIENILNNLKSAGLIVGFDDHDILIDLPNGGTVHLDDGLKEDILQHKQEILFLLRNRQYSHLRSQAEKLAEYLNSSAVPLSEKRKRLSEYENLVNGIADLEPFIQYYRESGLAQWYESGWVLIYSNLLNEIIVLIRSAEVKLPESAQVYPIYMFEEIQQLSGKPDDHIRAAHKTKKIFNGKIEASEGVKK